MEIIAKKKKSLIAIYAVLAVCGLAILAVGIALYYIVSFWELDGGLWALLIMILCGGPLITVIFTFLCFRVRFTAGTITYDGKNIDFGKGHIVSPARIRNVEYRKGYFSQRPDAWGFLTVFTADFVVKYYYIDRVEEVSKRLIELRDRARKDGSTEEE